MQGQRLKRLGCRCSVNAMQGKPIHQNLSTSFVNFTALLRHLREMQFVGVIRLELSSYEAEVIFTAPRRLQAREYDRLAGRVAQGEKAFRRIIERSREPLGRIHVFQAESKDAAAHLSKALIDDRIVAGARETIFGLSDTPVADRSLLDEGLSDAPSDEVIGLASELISTVKDPFDRAKMDFQTAFEMACAAIGEEYLFASPGKGTISFRDGCLKVMGKVPVTELFDTVSAVLSHMIRRLRGDARYGKLLIYTRHRLQQHLSERHAQYSRLGLVDIVDRMLA